MWPFRERPEPDRGLELRLESAEKKIRDLELDWASQYDKFHRLYLRLMKRAKEDQKKAEDAAESTNGEDPVPQHPPNPLAARLLNPYARG